MAASISPTLLFSTAAPAASEEGTRIHRRRRITPEAGRALEKLGHAVEYLSADFVHGVGSVSSQRERLAAVRMLMQLNREIYEECPELPTLRERYRSLLGVRAT